MEVKEDHRSRLFAASWTVVDLVGGGGDVEELVRLERVEPDRFAIVAAHDDREV